MTSALPVTEDFFLFSEPVAELGGVACVERFCPQRRLPSSNQPPAAGVQTNWRRTGRSETSAAASCALSAGRDMLNKIASELAALAGQHIGQPLQAAANDRRQTLVRLTFGIFVGGLIALLILLYSGIAIV
jgi:hypothetical protein